MKKCIVCHFEFDVLDWKCPQCDFLPKILNGFFAFSPELAQQNDGLPSSVHHQLDKLQETSFWFRVRNQLIQDLILRYFPKAETAMEIGCGSGYVLNGIRAVLPNALLTATEIYSNGLDYAAKRVQPPCDFMQMDARHLPFSNEFDLVGAFDVLEHIEEDQLVLKNIRDALKPNGGLIITVPQHPWLWSKSDEFACHKRRYTNKQLITLLQQNGFEILFSTSFMFFLLPIMFAQRYFANQKNSYDQTAELKLPFMLDKAFEVMLKTERKLINLGIRFPWGGSRLIAARVNETHGHLKKHPAGKP